MSEFGLNDPDETTIDEIILNLTSLSSYYKLIGTIVLVRSVYANKGI